jgi:hypothetical protein
MEKEPDRKRLLTGFGERRHPTAEQALAIQEFLFKQKRERYWRSD